MAKKRARSASAGAPILAPASFDHSGFFTDTDFPEAVIESADVMEVASSGPILLAHVNSVSNQVSALVPANETNRIPVRLNFEVTVRENMALEFASFGIDISSQAAGTFLANVILMLTKRPSNPMQPMHRRYRVRAIALMVNPGTGIVGYVSAHANVVFTSNP